MPEYMTVQAAVNHDRQDRRKMSRRVYAEATGLTENRVHALEHGKRLKPGELRALRDFIGDLVDPTIMAATMDPDATPPEPHIDPATTKEWEPSPEVARENERMLLGNEYIAVMEQLGNRIPPFAWPSQFRLETAPPVDFPAIGEWIQQVAGWLQEQDGVEVTEPAGGGTGPEGAEGYPAPDEAPAPTPSASEWDDEEVNEEQWYPADPIQSLPQHLDSTPGAQEATTDLEAVQLDPNLWYVTNGEMTTFADCPRRWMLQNYRRIGLPTERFTGPAMIGTRYHEALATWYQPQLGDPWLTFNENTKARQQLLEQQGADEDVFKTFNADTDLVRAMLEGYFQWVQEESADSGLTIVGPEQVVSVDPQIPGFSNVRLLAKLDVRVLQEIDMARLFLDHKTVGSFKDALKGLVGNEQMLTYHLIEYLQLVASGLDREQRSAGALYNMARKVKRTVQANPPFYMREPVKHNLDQLQSHWLRVSGRIKSIERARAALTAGGDHREVCPPRWTDDCSWKCEFYALCPMMDHSPNGAEAMIQDTFVQINPLKRYEPAAVGVTL